MFSDWSSHLAIDHAQIDHDHKNIIESIERLYQMSDTESAFEEIEDSFHDLLDIMAIHFAREEGIMVQTKYFDCAKHTKEHDYLLEIYGSYFYEKDARSQEVRRQILQDLSMILIGHIKEFDQPLACHCQKLAVLSVDGLGVRDIASRTDATRILHQLHSA